MLHVFNFNIFRSWICCHKCAFTSLYFHKIASSLFSISSLILVVLSLFFCSKNSVQAWISLLNWLGSTSWGLKSASPKLSWLCKLTSKFHYLYLKFLRLLHLFLFPRTESLTFWTFGIACFPSCLRGKVGCSAERIWTYSSMLRKQFFWNKDLSRKLLQCLGLLFWSNCLWCKLYFNWSILHFLKLTNYEAWDSILGLSVAQKNYK